MLHIARCPLQATPPICRTNILTASCCQAGWLAGWLLLPVGSSLSLSMLRPLGNVATCNWQLPPPFCDERAFFFATLALAINCGAACNLFDLPLLAKQPQFSPSHISPIPSPTALQPPTLRAVPFTVFHRCQPEKFGYLMQILCAVHKLYSSSLRFSLSLTVFGQRFGTINA